LVLIMALLDTMGVASILPFMAVISKPDIIQTNIYLNKMFEASSIFGVENNQEFLFVLGIFVFVLLVGSLTFKAFTFYVQARFIQMRQYSISKRLVEGYLQQPYSWFLNRNSADLGKTILTEVSMVVGNGLKPLMELITKGAVTIALVTLLVLVNPKLSLLVGLTTYIKRYSDPAKTMAQHRASSAVISQLPRFALEAIAFGGIMLMMLYLMRQTGGIVNALPIISLYVFAGYRLMPAMQSIYAALAKLRFVGASLDALVNDIKNLKILKLKKDQSVLSFNKHITLKNIY
jgi:ABC-type multidrug transport system fused ATPase/permease subunit